MGVSQEALQLPLPWCLYDLIPSFAGAPTGDEEPNVDAFSLSGDGFLLLK
jgi:hypothetical protein